VFRYQGLRLRKSNLNHIEIYSSIGPKGAPGMPEVRVIWDTLLTDLSQSVVHIYIDARSLIFLLFYG
jgi:hypothetical protein